MRFIILSLVETFRGTDGATNPPWKWPPDGTAELTEPAPAVPTEGESPLPTRPAEKLLRRLTAAALLPTGKELSGNDACAPLTR